ncbi:MAG: zonular occludens toxin domain-containing protein [Defluviitaleaceae bacterium]|nr:zonular occludens toxin domain-containing protein [Defluviitaleaceae bacterium]
MIKILTGTPGSGKSYNMARMIRDALRRKQNVISTVPINIPLVSKNGKKKIGDYKYIPIEQITEEMLRQYAAENHIKGKERQTLVFIDECQLIFNTRDWGIGGRREWIKFFTIHRHLGYDIILVTQVDSYIDKQIRALIEIEVRHKKASNMLWWLPWTVFIHREEWYGTAKREKLRIGMAVCLPSVFKIYDSYTIFDDICKDYKKEIPQPNPKGSDGGGRTEKI